MHERLKYQKDSDLKIRRVVNILLGGSGFKNKIKSNKSNKKTDNFDLIKIKDIFHAGEMAHWLRALAALPEDPVSISNTHMTAHHL